MAQMNFQCFFFLRTTNLGSEGTMPETIYGKENWKKKGKQKTKLQHTWLFPQFSK